MQYSANNPPRLHSHMYFLPITGNFLLISVYRGLMSSPYQTLLRLLYARNALVHLADNLLSMNVDLFRVLVGPLPEKACTVLLLWKYWRVFVSAFVMFLMQIVRWAFKFWRLIYWKIHFSGSAGSFTSQCGRTSVWWTTRSWLLSSLFSSWFSPRATLLSSWCLGCTRRCGNA